MKGKDEVSALMSKLTLKNNLDQEEEEEVVESVVVLEKNDSKEPKSCEENEKDAEYSSKGPVRYVLLKYQINVHY